jgi:hypothetical protein
MNASQQEDADVDTWQFYHREEIKFYHRSPVAIFPKDEAYVT